MSNDRAQGWPLPKLARSFRSLRMLKVMDPRGVEPLCRSSRQVASTRVAAVDRHAIEGRQQPRWNQDRLSVTRTSLSVVSSLPDVYGTSPYRALGGFRATKIRLRERTACWQLLLCMLLSWPACSTARDERTGMSGRSQFGPRCQRRSIIRAARAKSLTPSNPGLAQAQMRP